MIQEEIQKQEEEKEISPQNKVEEKEFHESNSEEEDENESLVKKEKKSTFLSTMLKIFLFLTLSILFGGIIFGFSYFFSFLFLLPYCGLLFRCGCTFLWLGGISKCNIYDPHEPHKCPWCMAPKSTSWLVNWGTPIVSTLGSYFFCFILTIIVLLRKRGSFYIIRTSLNQNLFTKIFGWSSFYLFNGIIFSIVSFLVYGLILGLAFKYATGNSYFFCLFFL
jgi:hypothetical protein